MFTQIKKPVQDQFNSMSKDDLFVVKLEKDELFNAYLTSLPEDERQSHTCNCCRTFLNNYGGIITIKDGTANTIWDFPLDGLYGNVPATLRALVLSKMVESTFISKFDKLGTDHNRQALPSGEIIRWDHFFVTLPANKVNRSSDSLESLHGVLRATKDVFSRSLETITVEAAETVAELIAQNTLYRGKEFEPMVLNFLKQKKAYLKLTDANKKDLFVWANFKEGGRIRNTAIGTLLVNLSEDMPIEGAVRAFEAMVAPANYKRPTALVTEKMIKQAHETMIDLGIDKSLKRRHATKDDIPVNNLLYVNRINPVNSVFDSMKAEVAVNPKSFTKAREVSLAEFVADILPTATSLEVLLENNSNFMSLIAPDDADTPNMFAWDNPISWTYQNNLTDVLKEKVKKAGGSVEGELRVSLEWFNYDDLDLHVFEPGNEISFRSKRSPVSDGFLDVDMNAGGGKSREAVENVIFTDKNRMREGDYKVVVNNFSKRENIDFGFNIQIECQGNVIDLSYPKAVSGDVLVATFKYGRNTGITNFKTSLTSETTQKEVNNVLTNRFQQVNMVMYSPNHWTNQIGNKHVFFIIDNAKIDNTLRPFFNEYLKPELQEHRKVFEILGSKLMVNPTDTQLTGVGFSLTQRNQLITRVNNTVIKVNI